MLTPGSELYIYALYTLLIASASTCVFVIYTLRGNNLPINSIKLFLSYFVIGIFGWGAQAYHDLFSTDINFSLSASFYVIASFILFVAVVECARNWKMTWFIALTHLIFIIFFWSLSNEQSLFLSISVYTLLIYPVIFVISLLRAIKNKNIGNAIIALACFISFSAAPLQIQQILFYNDINFTYSSIMILAAVGFVMVGIGFLTSLLINEHQFLTSMAIKDPLTGLLNRRGLDFECRIILASAKRSHSSMSVIAIDIDFFKKINDTYGHDGGDLALQNIAQILSSCPRESDVCCRLGGEEFVIVLPETEINDALLTAERIRAIIEQSTISSGENEIKLTASFGVACENTDIDIDRLLKDADKALYKAKEEGRNCVRQSF